MTMCKFNNAYRKPTFSKICKHFDSFLPSTYNFVGTFSTPAFRCSQICSSWTKSQTQLVCLKQIFLENGYPEYFMFQRFMDNIHVVKETTLTVEKRLLS